MIFRGDPQMQDYEREITEKILLALQEAQYLFPQFAFSVENGNLRVLGSGGFSTIYEMYSVTRPGKKYALKITGLQRHTIQSTEFWETVNIQQALYQESRYVMRILDAKELRVSLDDHGCLGEVWPLPQAEPTESGDTDGNILKMQFVLMEKLQPLLEKDRFGHVSLSKDALKDKGEILKFALEIGQALHCAHTWKILHRDIKLENIFWDEETAVYKLGDFGAAKCTEDGIAGTAIYTNGYGAPEVKQAYDSSYRQTADIYSFGIALYLLFNDLRFPGSEGYFSKEQLQYSPEFAFPAPSSAPAPVAGVIRKMCSFYPEDRYQSMADALSAVVEACKEKETGVGEDFLTRMEIETLTFRETGTPVVAEQSGKRKNTRADRIFTQKKNDQSYSKRSVLFFLFLTPLLIALQKSFQPVPPAARDWTFWLLPGIVMLEGILQWRREFHVIFGVPVIGCIIYAAYHFGFQLTYIILLAGTLTGCALLTISSAVATAGYTFISFTGQFPFLNQLFERDWGWIVLVCVLLVINRYAVMRIIHGRAMLVDVFWGIFAYKYLCPIVAAVGVLLIALEKWGGWTLPEPVQRAHLVRTCLLCFFFYEDLLPAEDDHQDDTLNSIGGDYN